MCTLAASVQDLRLACMPVWREAKIVNIISVLPRHDADRPPHATATASASTITRQPRQSPSAECSPRWGKKWHIAYADYSWGESNRATCMPRSRRRRQSGRHHWHPARHRLT